MEYLDTKHLNTHCIFYIDDLMFCHESTEDNQYLCDSHKNQDSDLIREKEKEKIVEIVKQMLQLCHTSVGKKNKAIHANNIFEILTKHKYFMNYHDKFTKTVYNKLMEFKSEDDKYFDSMKYLEEIFPLDPQLKNQSITDKLPDEVEDVNEEIEEDDEEENDNVIKI